MHIRTLLVVIRPDQDDALLDRAIALAEGRHLRVLVVAEAPPAPASAYDMLSGETWTLEVQRARDWARERANAVEAYLSDKAQPGDVVAHVAGAAGLADIVASACRYADLVLVDEDQTGDRLLRHAIVTGALFESGTPILIGDLPGGASLTPECVIVAWNATPEAARAVKAALPILKRAREVRLLLVDPVPTSLGHGEEPGATLATYLGHHDIGCEVVKMPAEGHMVEEVIADQVAAAGADLLVMGGYGHSRLRERIFGGTTQAILDTPPCCTLMAH